MIIVNNIQNSELPIEAKKTINFSEFNDIAMYELLAEKYNKILLHHFCYILFASIIALLLDNNSLSLVLKIIYSCFFGMAMATIFSTIPSHICHLMFKFRLWSGGKKIKALEKSLKEKLKNPQFQHELFFETKEMLGEAQCKNKNFHTIELLNNLKDIERKRIQAFLDKDPIELFKNTKLLFLSLKKLEKFRYG